MSYETKNIRNICLLGHGNSGKTSLAESMLFTTGAIDRQGKVSDGNTVSRTLILQPPKSTGATDADMVIWRLISSAS